MSYFTVRRVVAKEEQSFDFQVNEFGAAQMAFQMLAIRADNDDVELLLVSGDYSTLVSNKEEFNAAREAQADAQRKAFADAMRGPGGAIEVPFGRRM